MQENMKARLRESRLLALSGRCGAFTQPILDYSCISVHIPSDIVVLHTRNNAGIPLQVRVKRRNAGIEPYIPFPEDRPAMMSKYAETGKIPTTPNG